MQQPKPHTPKKKGGYTLLELTFSIAIYVVILLSTLGMLERDTHLSQAVLSTTHVEQMAQELIYRLKGELANAQGSNPMAIITENLDDDSTGELRVDSTLGFPNTGMLILDRGTNSEERIAYEELDESEEFFRSLERGLQCSQAGDHLVGSELVWGGLAEPIAQQQNPSIDQYDGLAMGVLGPVYFRGDGSGFSYRNPIDPSGGNDLLEGDKLKWGAVVSNVPTLDGWSALSFQPRYTFSEAKTHQDINSDGDKLDVYDVGVIGRRRWVTGDTDWDTDNINMGPSAVLQEQCNWGGDLDGDGFDDPIFLWDKDPRQLQIRLFVIGGISTGNPLIRKVESTIFLRNEVEI
jgi:type II secretory pathway pseudopilin PulG